MQSFKSLNNLRELDESDFRMCFIKNLQKISTILNLILVSF